MRGEASSVEGSRALRVSLGERLLWGETIESRQAVALRFGFVLPPGETVLIFSTDRPGRKMGSDPRELSFQVADLEIVVAP
jgi:hypothetical protein